jgi:Protein of unknown function (DUF2786)
VSKTEIISKIKKLLQLADSNKNSNVEEAAVAAAKAQSLMEKHRIKKAMLNEKEQIGWRALIDKGNPENWKLFLITALASTNGCYVVRSAEYEKDNQVNVVGEELDFETVQQLYTYLVNELNKLCILDLLNIKTSSGSYPSIEYAKSFYLGAVTTIRSRLEVARHETRQQEMDKAATRAQRKLIANALVRIDNKSEKAKDWVKNNLEAEFKSVPLDNTSPAGYNAGQEAANNISLTPERKSLDES